MRGPICIFSVNKCYISSDVDINIISTGRSCLGQLGNAECSEVDVVVVIGVDVTVAVLVELHPNPERPKCQTNQR